MNDSKAKMLSPQLQRDLVQVLKTRFEKNEARHRDIEWAKVQAKLELDSKSLWSLSLMENTGGEPDVVAYDKKSGQFVFCDCAAESPAGRRSLCFDREAFASLWEVRPEGSAVDMAAEIGIELFSEEQYREFQKLGVFDLKSSSWIKTPPEIRKEGGALFADRRYNRIFVYHSSASSFVESRGFSGVLKV